MVHIRDHEEVAKKYHTKTSLTIPYVILAVLVKCDQAQKCPLECFH